MNQVDQAVDWNEIERRLNFPKAQSVVRSRIIPLLRDVPTERMKQNGQRENKLETPMSFAFGGFIITFLSMMVLVPDNAFGGIFLFVAFIPLFFAWIGLAVFLFRKRFMAAIYNGQARFVARSAALSEIATSIALKYIPAPGGAPAPLKLISKQGWAPDSIKEAAKVLDDHGGMEDALKVARKSGVMGTSAIEIQADPRLEKHSTLPAESVHVEDGFVGQRGGVPFSAFEWIERGDEAPDVYHLVFVFELRRKLQGVTHLRSRKTSWPAAQVDSPLRPVQLLATDFEDQFKVRASDQTEARYIFSPLVLERVADLAKGELTRAVAFEDHLVFDISGTNRFALVDLISGEWSEATIAATLNNIAEMLELAEAVTYAFGLRPAA